MALTASRALRPSVFTLLILLVAAGSLMLRLPHLEQRPLHVDEAVQAVKTGLLFDSGVYHYNPREFHGPTLYYLSLPFLWLSPAKQFSQTHEVSFRLVPVVFGVGLILLLLALGDALGRWAALVAALLTAASPAMVFYSRYYIQEMLLVFFTLAVIASAWRYARGRNWGWLAVTGACVGLMVATKETAVIALACMTVAFLLALLWSRWRNAATPEHSFSWNRRHFALGLVFALAPASLLFSSFFTHPRGLLDALLTYGHYLRRSDGAGMHDHPWFYYLKMLIYWRQGLGPRWSEGLIVALAGVGFCCALRKKGIVDANTIFICFLSFYALLMILTYSLIPYKTPWNMLGFLHGMILLAGLGLVALAGAVRMPLVRLVVVALFALAFANLAWQAWRCNFKYCADPRNPYVYAHTVPDAVRLAERVHQVAKLLPENHRMLVKIFAPGSDYWPLPWYLREFDHVGYWDAPSAQPDAPMIIAAPQFQAELEGRLRDHYQSEFFGLRPGVLLQAYIRTDLWESFLRQSQSVTMAGGLPKK